MKIVKILTKIRLILYFIFNFERQNTIVKNPIYVVSPKVSK